jgi:Ca2+-binding RTX toxin-like protein
MYLKYTMRAALACALTSGAVMVAPAVVQAATLTNSGGTLTYAAADGTTSQVSFDEGPAGTIQVTRDSGGDDNDPITAADGCVEDAPTTAYTCPGVTRVVADAKDLNDTIDAGGVFTSSIGLTNAGADLRGGAGDDRLYGGAAADTVTGGAGRDTLTGAAGNDVVDGEAGDDYIYSYTAAAGPDGSDTVRGGAGIDFYAYGSSGDPAPAVSITLDGVANDGIAGENDNVATDVEDVFASSSAATTGPSGPVTITGSAVTNSLGVYDGTGNITGGPGNDMLNGGPSDDTINSRDGFADRVQCYDGNDTVVADDLDQIGGDCENVQVANVGNANEDRPPTVAFTAPASASSLQTKSPTTLTATASDDRGVSKVQFLDDDRVVCEDTTAPYTCAYQPRGGDVGRNTLVAIAFDSSQQTGSALRTVTVGRFAPRRLSLRVSPRNDKRAPFRFTSSGRLSLPSTVTPAVGCANGVVSVQIKAGKKTISTRRASLKRNCTYRVSVTFRDRQRFTSNGRLKFTARFGGNSILLRSSQQVANVKTK